MVKDDSRLNLTCRCTIFREVKKHFFKSKIEIRKIFFIRLICLKLMLEKKFYELEWNMSMEYEPFEGLSNQA